MSALVTASPAQIANVSRGLVTGHSTFNKFAENPDIDASQTEDIWDYTTEGTYTFSTSAAIDSVSSDNAGDTQVIVVEGLDENWIEVIQAVTLTGQTRSALETPLRRVYRAFNGNGSATSGNVYIYENTALAGGIPIDTSLVRAYISVAEQQTLMGVYTVPAGKTGYFLGFSASLSKTTAASAVIVTGKARPFEKIFRTQIRFALQSAGTSHVNVPSSSFSAFPEKTDFVASAFSSANNTGVSVTFDLLLVDNEK